MTPKNVQSHRSTVVAFTLSPRRLLMAGTALSLMVATSPGLAGPTGGSVRGGGATITEEGSRTVVDQTSSRAVVDWSSYNVGPTETVRYQHQRASDATLNVIHDSNPSVIEGRIESRIGSSDGVGGSVILFNGNGIAFANSARIDVGSLIATTVPPDIDAFRDEGHIVLDHTLQGTGPAGKELQYDPNASITNAGRITVADSGLAALVAPRIENSGYIQARLGSVQLATASTAELVNRSGDLVDITEPTVDFYGDGLVQFRVRRGSEVGDQLIRHAAGAEIDAQGGTVIMTADAASDVVNSAINLDGVIRAAGLEDDAGTVALMGEGGIAFGSQSLVEAGNGTVWIETSGDVTQEDGSAILTRDLGARGRSVQLTSWDNYVERVAGRAQATAPGDEGASGQVDFMVHQSNATGDEPEIASFDNPVIDPIGTEDLAGIGLDILIQGTGSGTNSWSFSGDHSFDSIEFSALPYSFDGLEWGAEDFLGNDSSDYFITSLFINGTAIEPDPSSSEGFTTTLPGDVSFTTIGAGLLVYEGSGAPRWGVHDGPTDWPKDQLGYDEGGPGLPESERLIVDLDGSFSSANGGVSNLFGPDTPLGTNRGNEQGRVTLIRSDQGAAEIYTRTRQATVTVTAEDASRLVGEANPEFAASIDPERQLARDWRTDESNLQFSTDATTESPAGTYGINPSGLGETTRFQVRYLPGTLTVAAAPPPTEPPGGTPPGGTPPGGTPPGGTPPEGPDDSDDASTTGAPNPFDLADMIRTKERGRDPDTPGDAVYRTTEYENPYIPDPLLRSYALGVAAGGSVPPEQLEAITPAAGPNGEVVLSFGGRLNDTTGQHARRPDSPIGGGSPVNLAGATGASDLEAIVPAAGPEGGEGPGTGPTLCSAGEFLADFWQCWEVAANNE